MITRARDGEQFRVVDCHVHLGRSPMFAQYRGGSDTFDGDAAVQAFDDFGIDAAVVFPMADRFGDYSEANETVLTAAAAHPGRLVPFVRFNPHYRDSAARIDDYVARGARGIKLHPQHEAFAINDRTLVHPLMEAAEPHGLAVVFHTDGAWAMLPGLLWDLALDFPGLNFVAGHSGHVGYDVEAVAAARRVPNLWLDMTGLWGPERVTMAVRTVGADRVLYGSDAPYVDAAAEIEKILRFAGLNDDELRAVLGENACSLLALQPEPAPAVPYPLAAR
jgi:predicted TIM-barrel fold metal-dependent hydrolase